MITFVGRKGLCIFPVFFVNIIITVMGEIMTHL